MPATTRFGATKFDSVATLLSGGCMLSAAAPAVRSVALDTRVRRKGRWLHAHCERIAASARMATHVCPKPLGWSFGPRGATRAGARDERHFLVLGWTWRPHGADSYI